MGDIRVRPAVGARACCRKRISGRSLDFEEAEVEVEVEELLKFGTGFAEEGVG